MSSGEIMRARRQEQIGELKGRELRSYQVEASEKALGALQGTGRALIDMAMGLGKTRVAVELVEKIKPKRVLVLADQSQLLKDHQPVFDAFLGEGQTSGLFMGEDKSGLEANVVFSTFQSMRIHQDKIPRDSFDMIIVDEAHHSMAPTYKEVIDYFSPKHLVGLTGTPDRTDWKDIRDVFGPPVVSITLAEGMKNGWLTPVDYRVVTNDIDERALEEFAASHPDVVTKKDITKLNGEIFKKMELKDTLKHLVEAVGTRQTAIMCGSIEEAEQVAYELREMGYIAEGFHIRSDDDESLARFRIGTTQFLTAVNKMNEGIDVPELEAVAFLRSTDSKRIFLQQLGRALRFYPGKERALILDYVGTIERLDTINQIMREAGVSTASEGEELDIIDTVGAGTSPNVFRFDQKLVDKILEVLQKNERRYASYEDVKEQVWALELKTRKEYESVLKERPKFPKNPEKAFGAKFEGWREFLGLDRFVGVYTLEEAQQFIKDKHLVTESQYAVFAAVVFQDQKRLPSLEELRARGEAYKLGLITYEEYKKRKDAPGVEQVNLAEAMMGSYDWGTLRSTLAKRNRALPDYGVSGYRPTKQEIEWALEHLVALGKGEAQSISDVGIGDTPWMEEFGLPPNSSGTQAKKEMLRIINAFADAGLLTKEFFNREVYDSVCELVLYRGEDNRATYKETKELVWSLSLVNRTAYDEKRKKYPKLPADPEKTYGAQFEGWREFLGVDRNLAIYPIEETVELVKKWYIKTPSQYKFFAEVVFAGNRRLPTIEELKERGAYERLGLVPFEELDANERGSSPIDPIMFHYQQDVFSFDPPRGRKTAKDERYGLSGYRATDEERAEALRRVVAIGKREIESPVDFGLGEHTLWEDVYSIISPEAEEMARTEMDKLITRLERKGFLTPEFFTPEILDVACSDVLSHVHEKTAGDYLPYQEAKEKVQAMNLKSRAEYEEMKRKKNSPEDLPRDPVSGLTPLATVYKEFEGWREFLGIDRYITPLTLEETIERIGSFSIQTYEQYACISPVIFHKENKRFPSIEELRAEGNLEKLGLKTIDEIVQETGGNTRGRFWDNLDLHIFSDYIYNPDAKIERKKEGKEKFPYGRLGGISDYNPDSDTIIAALKELEALAKGEKQSASDSPLGQHASWSEIYGLQSKEEIDEAVLRMRGVLDRIARAGLMTKEFFLPIIYHDICENVLAQVRSEFWGSVDDDDPSGGPLRAIRGPRKGKAPDDP